MINDRVFLKVDLLDWIEGTIKKFEAGQAWNSAWRQTYSEIGGRSEESGKKVCPMAAARTLYEMGRITSYGKAKTLPLSQVIEGYSKNGAYAIAAVEYLQKNPNINSTALWKEIQRRIRSETGVEPAGSNQGGPTLTYKLWKLGRIQ